MSRIPISSRRALGITVALLLAMPIHAAPTRRFDSIKGGFVELPVKRLVARAIPLPMPRPAALSKQAAVQPAASAKPIAAQAPPISKPATEAPAAVVNSGTDAPVNPTVSPGDVKWHASFAAATSAAKKSGRPVLLFHMMGHLDKQFC